MKCQNEKLKSNSADTVQTKRGLLSRIRNFIRKRPSQSHQHDDPNFCAWGYPMNLGDSY